MVNRRVFSRFASLVAVLVAFAFSSSVAQLFPGRITGTGIGARHLPIDNGKIEVSRIVLRDSAIQSRGWI
jgi:hypothetical protein